MQDVSRFLTGLLPAVYTPFHEDGTLDLEVISRQAEHVLRSGVTGVFVCGTTGECHSLTLEERIAVAEEWRKLLANSPLKLVVHVSHNCVHDAAKLAAHAQSIGADAIATTSPSYFRPQTVEDLINFCRPVAEAAALPFYYYSIPSFTMVNLAEDEFMSRAAETIPTLAGIKFSSMDLAAIQRCIALDSGHYNVLCGVDELVLPAMTLGAHGGVGSTYNFLSGLFKQLLAAFASGHLSEARVLQGKALAVCDLLRPYGNIAAGKALLSRLGVDCGPVRPPLHRLSDREKTEVWTRVSALGCL